MLGADHVFITNGGPTEPLDAAGNRIERETPAAQNPAAALMGRVLYLGRHGRAIPVADIYAFERRVNPDAATGNDDVDSNPVGLAFGRHGLYVADAGGNAIDVVHPFGRVSNLTVFPNRTVPGDLRGLAHGRQAPARAARGHPDRARRPHRGPGRPLRHQLRRLARRRPGAAPARPLLIRTDLTAVLGPAGVEHALAVQAAVGVRAEEVAQALQEHWRGRARAGSRRSRPATS